MMRKGTKLRRFRVKLKRKLRGLQDMFDVELALVTDENQDSRHGLEDAMEHLAKALTSQAIPPVSSLKAWVRSQKCLESGTFGQKCTLKTNYFLITSLMEVIYQYDVCISPEKSRRTNRAVMARLCRHRKSHFAGHVPAYDGGKSLYTAGPLPFSFGTFEIELQDNEDILHDRLTQESHGRVRKFMVVIKFVARVGLQPSHMDLAGGKEDVPHVAHHALNIILREIFIQRCGRRYPLSFQPGEGLEVSQDFYKNLQLTQKGLLLNIDVSSTLFMKGMPVINYIAQLLDRDILDRPLSGDDHSKIKKALRGMMVRATLTNRTSTYLVLGLTRAARELCASSDDHGTVKPFVDYFHETYGYKIKYTNLPCLEVRARQKLQFLPVEVCIIAKKLHYSKQLNRDQMSTLLEVARLHPGMRQQRILEANNSDFFTNSSYAKAFGIKLEKQLLSVDARMLPPPWLKFHDTGMTKEFLPQVGRWNMIRKRMFHGGVVRNWACVNFSWEVEGKIISSFCHELAIMCQASGMDFSVDPVLPVVTFSPEDAEWTLKSCLLDVMKRIEQELDILIVILPNNKSALYGNLKTICETDIGLVSQCCLAKHVLKMRKQYLANVALKINVKVGGKNTVLLDAFTRRLPCVGDMPTIILGAHVMHPGKSSSPSIAAVVASQDWPEVTNYAALASAQANGQEFIQDLFHVPHDCKIGAIDGGMIKQHLISFERANGQKPQRIIYYRDAVSNQQLYQVMWQELIAIKKACNYWDPNYKPAVTYVVLQKCHHTCFFADDEDNRSFLGTGNVLPGTVVDSDICHPNEFGFYLCSQDGTQGTTRPVYYRMLWDESRFTADTFQCLTNYLCYTYARCTHSVSFVPPVYYAHLMTLRGRMYMESTTPKTRDEGHGSSSGASSSGAKSDTFRPIPGVKDNVKRTMFYC